jgi:hypothetical protein
MWLFGNETYGDVFAPTETEPPGAHFCIGGDNLALSLFSPTETMSTSPEHERST